MAQPPAPATATVTIAIPILDNIFQSVRHLEDEVRNVSTRLSALELQLAQQTKQSSSNVIADLPHDIADDTTLGHEDPRQEADRVDDANLHVQTNDRFRRDDPAHNQQDDIIQEDENITRTQEANINHNHESVTQQVDANHTQQDDVTQEDENITQEMDLSHEDAVTHTHEDRESPAREDGQSLIVSSSPSVDVGITAMAKPVVPAPAAATAAATAGGGKKRKRTIHDAPAHIDRSGFMIRSSDARLAEERNGEVKGPSRSESPFDNSNRDGSSDGLDQIPPKPPVGTQSLSSSKPEVRRRQPRAQEAGLDEFVAPKEEGFTISRYGRIRNQTQGQSGFVATPAKFK
ncbi:hypothetical protein KCU81_g1519, partial [Aureobasidium melanogenum]|uniref:Uncharacterized protein n=1 Tax=Aureobasidium melanogenum (strain CBS 110374) TaxID=1043003 RepID=A0A074W8K2_AURM1